MYEYQVDAFVPDIGSGCNVQNKGWDPIRCNQFADFLNGYAEQGWKLHSSEYRQITGTAGCGGKTQSSWLVCVFEKAAG